VTLGRGFAGNKVPRRDGRWLCLRLGAAGGWEPETPSTSSPGAPKGPELGGSAPGLPWGQRSCHRGWGGVPALRTPWTTPSLLVVGLGTPGAPPGHACAGWGASPGVGLQQRVLLRTFLVSPSPPAPAEPPFCFRIGVLGGSRPVPHLPATSSVRLAVLPPCGHRVWARPRSGEWWVLAGHPNSFLQGSPQSGLRPQIQGPALLLPVQTYPGDGDRSEATPGQGSVTSGRSHHGPSPSWALVVPIPAAHRSGAP